MYKVYYHCIGTRMAIINLDLVFEMVPMVSIYDLIMEVQYVLFTRLLGACTSLVYFESLVTYISPTRP